MSTHLSLHPATDIDMDYQPLTEEEVVFLVGDTNGTERCVNITILEDLLVEREEEFIVTLAIITSNANLFIDNANTTVSIIDNDGIVMHSFHHAVFIWLFNAEATFSVPTSASVEEEDSLFMTCVMLATEENVMLGVEIAVQLNTSDNTSEMHLRSYFMT